MVTLIAIAIHMRLTAGVVTHSVVLRDPALNALAFTARAPLKRLQQQLLVSLPLCTRQSRRLSQLSLASKAKLMASTLLRHF